MINLTGTFVVQNKEHTLLDYPYEHLSAFAASQHYSLSSHLMQSDFTTNIMTKRFLNKGDFALAPMGGCR